MVAVAGTRIPSLALPKVCLEEAGQSLVLPKVCLEEDGQPPALPKVCPGEAGKAHKGKGYRWDTQYNRRRIHYQVVLHTRLEDWQEVGSRNFEA